MFYSPKYSRAKLFDPTYVSYLKNNRLFFGKIAYLMDGLIATSGSYACVFLLSIIYYVQNFEKMPLNIAVPFNLPKSQRIIMLLFS